MPEVLPLPEPPAIPKLKGNDDGIVGLAPLVPVPKRAGAAGSSSGSGHGHGEKPEAKPPLPLPPPLPPPPVPPPPLPPVVEPPPAEPDDADGIVGLRPVPVPEPLEQVEDIDWVDGLGERVKFQWYWNKKDRRYYPNWRMQCHEPGHPHDCEKTRGVHKDSTKVHGRIEPLAFLFAWKPIPKPATASHARQNPTQPMVNAFAEAHKEELEELYLKCYYEKPK